MDYFIDSNIIIGYFSKQEIATEKLKLLIEQEHNLYINRLVYLESLRVIEMKKTKVFRESQDFLSTFFESVDINQDIYNQCVMFSRYCKSKGITLKGRCEAIDFLHFMTARYYEYELVSHDKDMETLATHYPQWLESLKTTN